MVIAEPGWLRTAGQAAGTILLLELGAVLLVLCILMGVLVYVGRWLRRNVLPIFEQFAPRAEHAMSVAQQGSDRVVRSVSEFYGRQQALVTGVRVLLFGKDAAQRVHEEALIHADADLQATTPLESPPGSENTFTPQLTAASAAASDGHQEEPARRTPRSPRAASGKRESEYPDMGTLAGNAD